MPALPASSDWYWYSSPEAPFPFQFDRAHHGEGQLPVGLDPLGLGDQVDAGQVEGGDLGGHAVGHPVGQVDEPGVLGELGPELGVGESRAPGPGRRRWRPDG